VRGNAVTPRSSAFEVVVTTEDGKHWLVWSKFAMSVFPKGPEVIERIQAVLAKGSGEGVEGVTEVPGPAQDGEGGCVVQ
jgi:hypothetical protein